MTSSGALVSFSSSSVSFEALAASLAPLIEIEVLLIQRNCQSQPPQNTAIFN